MVEKLFLYGTTEAAVVNFVWFVTDPEDITNNFYFIFLNVLFSKTVNFGSKTTKRSDANFKKDCQSSFKRIFVAWKKMQIRKGPRHGSNVQLKWMQNQRPFLQPESSQLLLLFKNTNVDGLEQKITHFSLKFRLN